MRPGQTAPECESAGTLREMGDRASMRPGQTAPECRRNGRLRELEEGASMRPGQTAPECDISSGRVRVKNSGFNEAGADCPGMPRRAKGGSANSPWLQ